MWSGPGSCSPKQLARGWGGVVVVGEGVRQIHQVFAAWQWQNHLMPHSDSQMGNRNSRPHVKFQNRGSWQGTGALEHKSSVRGSVVYRYASALGAT